MVLLYGDQICFNLFFDKDTANLVVRKKIKHENFSFFVQLIFWKIWTFFKIFGPFGPFGEGEGSEKEHCTGFHPLSPALEK